MKSRPFDVITSPLTDAAIFRYMLAGKYGPARQKWAQAQEKLKLAKKKARPSVSKPDTEKGKITKELQALLDL